MPVTAKLSKRFYEVLGEEIANELVEWFNMVDATYRGELRELNELNYARFDAKVEQRFAEAEARLAERLGALEAKWAERLGALETNWDRRFVRLETGMETRLEGLKAELLRWMFLFWVGSLGALVLARVL